jgi:hypothetical protein
MLATEQTIVLPDRMTSFTAVCHGCLEQLAALEDDSWTGARISGVLWLEDDAGWAICTRGHRVRLIRAGRFEEHRLGPRCA